MPDPTIRRRQQRDLASLVEVLRAVHDQDGYPVRWPADPCSWLTPPAVVGAWTAHREAGPVGHVLLTDVRPGEASSDIWTAAVQADTPQLVCVSRLFVAPAARRAGVADALLDVAESTATGSGRRAVLEVAETDGGARSLYERRGWYDVGGVPRDWLPTGTLSRLYLAPP